MTGWHQHKAAPRSSGPGDNRAYGRVMRPIFLLITSLLLVALADSRSQGDENLEYEVKLAFLYNFTQFVQWPPDAFPDAAAPLIICVAGEDPFSGDLKQRLRNRTAGGHRIDIKSLAPADDPRACHMVFVRAADKKEVPKILASLRGSSALTVGETKGFAERGGVINLAVEENKLRFEINVEAAAQTRVKISSKLLALARIVKEPTHP